MAAKAPAIKEQEAAKAQVIKEQEATSDKMVELALKAEMNNEQIMMLTGEVAVLKEAVEKSANYSADTNRRLDEVLSLLSGKVTPGNSPVNATETVITSDESKVDVPDFGNPTTPVADRRQSNVGDAQFSLFANARNFAGLTPMNLGVQTNRRMSNFELVRDTVETPMRPEAFSTSVSPVAPTVFVQSEDFKDITWQVDKLDAFLNFCEKVNEYDVEHERKIPSLYARMSLGIKWKVAQALYRIDSSKFNQHAHFLGATRAEIIRAVQYHYLPRDRNDFLAKLKESCLRYQVAVVEYDFRDCAAKLNLLRLKFLERFNFLKQGCELGNPQAIPSMGFKEGCIYNAFLELTPLGSRSEFKTLLYDRAGSEINEFMDVYFALVDSTLEKSIGLLHMCKRLGLEVPQSQARSHNKSGAFRSKQYREPAVLALMEDTGYGDLEDLNMHEFVDLEGGYADEDEESVQQELYALQKDSAVKKMDQRKHGNDSRALRPNSFSDVKPRSVQKMAASSDVRKGSADRPSRVTICHFMEQSGQCAKGNACRFSHDARDILEYRKLVNKRYFEALKVDGAGKAPGDVKAKPKAFVMEDVDEREQDDVSIASGSSRSSLHLMSELLKISKDASKWVASHRAAEIFTGRTSFKVNAALFDSGANLENYVSSAFVEEHGLGDLLHETSSLVEVADGSVAAINKALRLHVTFRSADMTPYSAWVDFNVFPGLTKDIVLGFKTCCLEFAELFKELIDEGREAFSRARAAEGDLCTVRRCAMLDYSSSYVSSEEDGGQDMYSLMGIRQSYTDGVVDPWTRPSYDLAPEEKYIPEPDSYRRTLRFMEVPVEQARREFLQDLITRVDPEFVAKKPKVMKLLQTKGMRVFVPESWLGIKGFELDLEFKDNMPSRLKPKARPIPPALLDSVNTEIKRLLQYFWEPSTSSITSPLVIAAKATAPFIRICGDYRVVNKLIVVFNYPIPVVIHELHKAKGFVVFIDLDIKNAFHQIKLSSKTSAILSVQTPMGQFQPKFLPEGVAPASGFLMMVMYEIFNDFLDFMVVVFDNLLICAHDYEDAYVKLERVLDRCIERNIYLKLSKCMFGIKEVTFFGYRVNGQGFYLSEDRRDNISKTPFPEAPKQVKKMQAFLGAANYFKMFVPLYSKKTAPLTDMIHKNFSWDPASWTVDYRGVFEDLKTAIMEAQTAYHPDFSLQWVLCVDASDYAIGGVLFQIPEGAVGEKDLQVIAFVSKKLSGAARNWSVIEKECFSIFYSVKKLSYYLFGKQFIIKTDHYNLLWMEASEIPKIVRMRVFLQSYNFQLKHIKGKDNIFADFLSRMYSQDVSVVQVLNYINMSYDVQDSRVSQDGDDLDRARGELLALDLESLKADVPASVDDALKAVHNSRLGHGGAARTYAKLHKFFPGLKVSIRYVEDFVRACPICQKLRLDMSGSLSAPVRFVDPQHCRQFCSFDTLYVSPADEEGYMALHCVRMIPSRLIGLYPVKELGAEGVALALFQYFVTYGVTEVLITDPGSNINADAVKLLLLWFGIRLRMSLTNRHQSSLIERSHRETLRFLSDLVHEERVVKIWAKPHILGMVQFIMNSEVSKETNISPFQYVFGDSTMDYFKLPDLYSDKVIANQFLSRLNEQFKLIRDVAIEVQRSAQAKRVAEDPIAGLSAYQVGDYLLKRQDPTKFKVSKLSAKYLGPYQVVNVYKADISVKDLITGAVLVFHMDDLKPFYGSDADAFAMAQRDNEQYVIGSVLSYRGDPLKRKSCEFLVLFADGDKVWLPWSVDLVATVQFEAFCLSKSHLFPLTVSAKQWNQLMLKMNKGGIKDVQPGTRFYLDLRYFGDGYYQSLDLPERDFVSYVVECTYSSWRVYGEAIVVDCPVFDQTYIWNAAMVFLYGCSLTLAAGMVIVDGAFVRVYPQVLKG